MRVLNPGRGAEPPVSPGVLAAPRSCSRHAGSAGQMSAGPEVQRARNPRTVPEGAPLNVDVVLAPVQGSSTASEPDVPRPGAHFARLPASHRALNVRSGEILADEEQGTLGAAGERVGEAVSEVERGGVEAPAPPCVGVGRAARHRRVKRHDFEAESAE